MCYKMARFIHTLEKSRVQWNMYKATTFFSQDRWPFMTGSVYHLEMVMPGKYWNMCVFNKTIKDSFCRLYCITKCNISKSNFCNHNLTLFICKFTVENFTQLVAGKSYCLFHDTISKHVWWLISRAYWSQRICVKIYLWYGIKLMIGQHWFLTFLRAIDLDTFLVSTRYVLTT